MNDDVLTAPMADACAGAASCDRTSTAGPVDLNAALARLGGNMGLYQQIYRMFRVDAESMIGQIADLMTNGLRPEAGRVSHTLKGLGATMGATVLATAAQQVEAAMARAASGEDAALLAVAGAAFSQACCSIEQALPALSASACGPVNCDGT